MIEMMENEKEFSKTQPTSCNKSDSVNKSRIVESLTEKSKTVNELSDELCIGRESVEKLLVNLEREDIVTVSDVKMSDGRLVIDVTCDAEPKFLANQNAGMSAIVDFCNGEIYLCDIAGKLIKQESYPMEHILTSQKIEEMILKLRKMISQIEDVPLSTICVVTAGMFDSQTGEFIYANRIKNYKEINLQKQFCQEFDVPVAIINDTQVMIIGEQTNGCLKNANNASLINVGDGVSSALMLNGVTYNGEKGIAGEIGLIQVGENGETIEEICSVNSICELIKVKLVQGTKSCLTLENLTLSEVAKAYHNEDPLATAIIDLTAEVLAQEIKNMVLILDCEIVLCGDCICFGDKYIQALKKTIDTKKYLQTKISFSKLPKEKAIMFGATQIAKRMTMKNLFKRI